MELTVGLDEAGRGPLAGPVVAAAVVLPVNVQSSGVDTMSRFRDSKTLTHQQRETLYEQILATGTCGVGCASVAEIDSLNILNATMLAMERAFAALPRLPDLALVDGNRIPNLPVPARAIVGGDATEPAISAASIVAKVIRDRLMQALSIRFPEFGFDTNRGYPVPTHKKALERFGPTPAHRHSFAPVHNMLRVKRG